MTSGASKRPCSIWEAAETLPSQTPWKETELPQLQNNSIGGRCEIWRSKGLHDNLWFNFRKVEQPPKSECQHHLLISLLAASVICLLTRQIPGAMEGLFRSWAGSDVLMWNNQCVFNRFDSSPLVTIAIIWLDRFDDLNTTKIHYHRLKYIWFLQHPARNHGNCITFIILITKMMITTTHITPVLHISQPGAPIKDPKNLNTSPLISTFLQLPFSFFLLSIPTQASSPESKRLAFNTRGIYTLEV